MITLHRHKDDQQAAKIEEKLQDLVLAYQVEEIEGEISDLFIEDGGEKIQGKEEIETWFRKLEGELKWQRSISGDGCYINPETGNVC
ncbi:hypothetical protein [Rhodohalobacter sulfatireducens]|uniref:Uncharacterized protein n=1 Tax=Rhodohalobacter sulfatireducens TaxID=2911366 RepID=A0ABS9KCE8_9BACT|nr:hypothetical protein [Rhodohalobacter sulfatireducens]MCG2588523.1 hypothetical protein [Rhodohalobacter sulfatireducens]